MKSSRFVALLAILVSVQLLAQSNRALFANQVPGLRFAPAVPYVSGGNGANAIAIADVNGDGKSDLVVTNWCSFSSCTVPGNNVGVLLGNGDGTFQKAVAYASGGLFADSVAVADLNGDGKPDLVVANCGANSNANCAGTSGNVAVLLQNPDGTFGPAVPYALGGGGYGATSVALADIDGDGKLDLVVAAGCPGGGCVGVLLGNGDGTFQPELTPNSSAGFAALSVAVGDVNGDGHPDVVVANQCTDNTCTSSNVGVLLGKGDGTFHPVVPYGPGGIFTDWIVIADVNGDARPDIVVANSSTSLTKGQGNVGILLGNGDGTFQTAVAYPSGGFGAAAVAVADVNGDGKPDVVVVNCSVTSGSCVPAGGNAAVLLGKGDGTFQKAVIFGAGGNAPFASAVGDLNGDKKPDVMSANCVSGNCGSGTGTVGVLINTSTTGKPAVTFSPTSLTFATQLVSTTSKAQPVKLTNTGTAVLVITKISVTGTFSETNQCPAKLKPKASCTINVTFEPKTKGVLHGSVNVNDNAGGSPQKVPLTGTGTYVELSPAKLNFGSLPVGTRSQPKKVTLTNRGQQTLNITSITITGADAGDFAETNNCGKQVAPGGSCSIQVTFKPLKKGNRTANFSVTDDGGASPQKVVLLGTGT